MTVLYRVQYISLLKNMILRPVALASMRYPWEMHNLRPHPRTSESESAFYQDAQVIFMHIKFGEAPL